MSATSLPGAQQAERLGWMGVGQGDLEAGMALGEGRQGVGHEQPMAEEKPASRTRPAFRPTCADSSAPAASSRPRISAAAGGEELPGRSEPDAAPDPLQELRAGLGLEPGEVVADRGLGAAQLLRRRGDRSAACDGVDDPEPGEVEHSSSLSMSRHKNWHWTHEPIGGTLAP